MRSSPLPVLIGWLWAAPLSAAPVPTSVDDFVMAGTQPQTLPQEIQLSTACLQCHGGAEAIYPRFQGSLMAHAGRDPLFYACMTIANQDAPGSGEMCIRCHMPRGWLAGRSTPPNGSALTDEDRDSINCMFCHQMVDPINPFNDAPVEDDPIKAALGAMLPTSLHNASFVIDPDDSRRRGPFDDAFATHPTTYSPFHARSEFCATCHDVSNPVYSKQPDGTYAANAWQTPAPSFEKTTVFPIERTYSEWSASSFAVAPIDMGGRFGGNKQAVSTCQDCHMPDASGKGCNFFGFGTFRDDLPMHDFRGASTWVLDAIVNLYPTDPNVVPSIMDDARLRNIAMLQSAADLVVIPRAGGLAVRVINQTGHKLPSGYPEGRRIWLNVLYRDSEGAVVGEMGGYNGLTADLDHGTTKVYQVHLGIDATVSGLTGIPAGPGFHFALNNVVEFDNRIPPRGFTNAGFTAVQAPPVNYTYADGQYWDDSLFTVPVNAVSAEVTLYYQTSSKEYITFLKDQNVTDSTGQTLYDQWELTGKSAPVLMATATRHVALFGDLDGDTDVDQTDFGDFQVCLSGESVLITDPHCTAADSDGDEDVDLADVLAFQANMTGAKE